MNWSIKLPNSYKEIYSIDSGPSFHGDGERYNIFDYKNQEEVISPLQWEKSKNVMVESPVKRVISSLNVPKEYMPNFQEPYMYYSIKKKDSSIIYLIFFPDIKRLYIAEVLF